MHGSKLGSPELPAHNPVGITGKGEAIATEDVSNDEFPPCTCFYVAATGYYQIWCKGWDNTRRVFLAAGVPHYIPISIIYSSIGTPLNSDPAAPDVTILY